MNWISSHLLTYMVNAEVIPNEQKYLDFYRYGLEITISTILNFVLVLLIGIVTQHLIESVVFLFTFILLRVFSGGYHANTYFRCNLLMCCSFLVSVLIYDFILKYAFTLNKISFLFITISLLLFFPVIIAFCPVEHINKPINSESKRKRMKIITIIIGVVFSTIGSILIYRNINIGVMILLTQILVSVLIIAAKLKKGGTSHEKKE